MITTGAAAAAAFLAASSGPVNAAFPGDDGLLAFSRNGIWVAVGLHRP